MKKRFSTFVAFFFLCLPVVSSLMAQELSMESLIARKQDLVQRVDTSHLSSDQILLVMDFNSAVILNPQVAERFKNRRLIRAELIYTAYRLSQTFSQPRLNLSRLENLKRLSPQAFSDTLVKWEFFAQTEGKTEEEARKMFHGFRLTFAKMEKEERISPPQKEIAYLLDLVNNDSLGKDSLVVVPVKHLKKRRIVTDKYEPRLAFKKKLGMLYDKPGIWKRRRLVVTGFDTIVKQETVSRFNVSKDAYKYISKLHDTTVFAVLNRNPGWTNILFVCDVTGSMSPYSAQLLIWSKLNFNRRSASYFTFFNDGDNMPDYKKQIGQTGGIYHVEAKRLKDIVETATTAMKKGWGGDTPENYIEALSDALKRFPAASDIVLVADNWAPIKDIELLGRIKRPVHVILCGADQGSVNMDYVRLALKTKGSVHTMEQDLNELSRLKEGEQFRIGQQTFQVMKGGRIRQISL